MEASNETMTIREMCDEFDVTPRTLRFYESKALLAPERIGTRRLFTRRDRARLKLILRGRRFGFSLEEIRQWLELYESHGTRNQYEVWIELADRQLGVLEEQIDDLIEVRRELRELRDESLAILTRMTGAD